MALHLQGWNLEWWSAVLVRWFFYSVPILAHYKLLTACISIVLLACIIPYFINKNEVVRVRDEILGLPAKDLLLACTMLFSLPSHTGVCSLIATLLLTIASYTCSYICATFETVHQSSCRESKWRAFLDFSWGCHFINSSNTCDKWEGCHLHKSRFLSDVTSSTCAPFLQPPLLQPCYWSAEGPSLVLQAASLLLVGVSNQQHVLCDKSMSTGWPNLVVILFRS